MQLEYDQKSRDYDIEVGQKELARKIIEGLGDPKEQANLYKKVYSDCCDVPQSGCGCINCSGGKE